MEPETEVAISLSPTSAAPRKPSDRTPEPDRDRRPAADLTPLQQDPAEAVRINYDVGSAVEALDHEVNTPSILVAWKADLADNRPDVARVKSLWSPGGHVDDLPGPGPEERGARCRRGRHTNRASRRGAP